MTLRDDEAEELLKAEGLNVTRLNSPGTAWSLSFDVDGENVPALLFLLQPREYFVSMVVLRTMPEALDDLSPEALRAIIRAQSQVLLSKIEYWPTSEGERGIFVATSECSTENITGDKLRRRIEACAQLARRVSTEIGALTA